MSNCTECVEWKESWKRGMARESALLGELSVYAARLRCEAQTTSGARCTRHPWGVRDGRPVCGQHRRAKEVRFVR